MKVYVVTKCFFHGLEATCLGVFRKKKDAIEAIESDDEIWNDDFRAEEEEFWGSEEASATIEEHEVG